jgi:hypothetical protein
MDEIDLIEGEEPQRKKRSRVKWISFIFAAALLFLGFKIHLFARGYSPDLAKVDAAKVAEQLAALARVSRLFFALGGVALVAGVLGSAVRAAWVRLVELLEAVAFLGAGGYLLALRGSARSGGLFDSPILPAVLIVIGLVKAAVAIRELRRPGPPG